MIATLTEAQHYFGDELIGRDALSGPSKLFDGIGRRGEPHTRLDIANVATESSEHTELNKTEAYSLFSAFSVANE